MVLAPHEESRESGGGRARPPSMATNHKNSVMAHVEKPLWWFIIHNPLSSHHGSTPNQPPAIETAGLPAS